jgi:hypothetical protein
MRRPAQLATFIATATILLGAAPAAAAGGTVKSRDFAGYEVSMAKGQLRHVAATVVVPRIQCQSSFSGVGPSVIIDSNVAANGSTTNAIASGAGFGLACENGHPFYESTFIVNNQKVDTGNVLFAPGDVIEMSATVTPDITRVRLVDETSHVTRVHTGNGHRASETFVGDESIEVDGVSGRVGPFSPTHLSDVLVNGSPINEKAPLRFNWVRNGRTLVSTGPLEAGDDFTLTFRHSG